MKTHYHLGDRVRIPLGRGKALGVITEDHGALGAGGKHLFRVSVWMDPFEDGSYEVQEDELEKPVEDSPLAAAEIISFLKNGGLISILRSNISGGRNQPRAWLRRDSLGSLTHTFQEERGLVGGETIPFWVCDGDRIEKDKRETVVEYLKKSFALTKRQAEEVVDAVGTK